MNHTVNMCPLTEFEGGLNLLHEADDDAVIWLESTATAALANNNNQHTARHSYQTALESYQAGRAFCAWTPANGPLPRRWQGRAGQRWRCALPSTCPCTVSSCDWTTNSSLQTAHHTHTCTGQFTVPSHWTSRRHILVFGHVARLDDDTPANMALQLHINVSLYRPPDRTWRRPPGRPRNKWLNQLRNDSTRPTGHVWRCAVDCGHGGATTWQPLLATRPWWWWWWWW